MFFLSILGNFHLVFSYAKIVQRNYCVGNRKVKEMLLKSKKIIEFYSIVSAANRVIALLNSFAIELKVKGAC